MEFRILGPLEVVDGGRTLTLGGPRQRALLALLLTRANHVVSSDSLIDALWGSDAPRTALNALQYHVSKLRKSLTPSEAIVTEGPGYVMRVTPDELDLLRFERLREAAHDAQPDEAARVLRQALSLWRGPPLVDLAREEFAQAEIRRLEELRITTVEQRIDADLALGLHHDVVAELESVVREHPLRERLRGQLMLALYRSGRQAEALNAYRDMRRVLVDELGLEPSPALQELEQAILRQDAALLPERVAPGSTDRSIVVIAAGTSPLDGVLAIAEPLAMHPTRELIIARLLQDSDTLGTATRKLAQHRSSLAERGVHSRVAAYVSSNAGDDAARFATEHSADLVLVDATSELSNDGRVHEWLAVVLERVPCDVGLLVGASLPRTGPVVTPFGGVEHDWSAIELAAWLAGALGTTLRLLGTEAEPDAGRRDASRLLARASLLVQQVVGIVTEPVLVQAGQTGVLRGARDARLLVIGLSERWRSEGIGPVRTAVAADVHAPTIFVRRGLRPSGVAPSETLTRFTWTLGPSTP
jgi:DNA-binding SARP family transcriptional activator